MTNKLTIICVDDERNVLLMLRNQLMHFFSDSKIEIAESGNEALEVIEEILSNGGGCCSGNCRPNYAEDERG